MKVINLSKIFVAIFILFTAISLHPKTVSASQLSTAKDTITTSRPSAASPISANAATSDVQLSIYNNGSRYLASDSARIIRTNTGNFVGNAVTVASQSAALTTVFLPNGGGISAPALKDIDVLLVPITAMHTVTFKTINAIPASGKIVIQFPGGGSNIASASASTFSFNGLTSANAAANISYNLDGSATCTFTVSAPTITCAPSTGIAANTTITFNIGCADAATNSATCTAQSPRLINPTKTVVAGTADQWRLSIQTQDSASNIVDSARVAIATIETVEVKAAVDAYLTFTIAGIANGSAVNTGNTTGCTINSGEVTNTGIASTSTAVDLGTLANTPSAIDTAIGNEAAQLLTVTTNGAGGYTLTATSSGQLLDPSSGFFINSSTTPASFPSAIHYFGIHPCGLDVSAATWVEGGASQTCRSYITGSSAVECKYAWPTQTTAVTLATDSIGPVGNTVTAGNGLVTMLYAAGADATVPAGSYRTTITYVATGTF